MAIKEQLTQSANIVKDEFRPGANTATRIGNLFLQIIDALVDIEQVDSSYLSKVKEDIATELLTFLKGISVGENNDASITADGNGYFKNIKVADTLQVKELQYNVQKSVEGEIFFTDSARIKEVTPTGDNTYYLDLDQREFERLSFAEHDVLRGSVNSNTGVTVSWMRVTRVDYTNYSISIVVYPDSETTAGVNYAPTRLMVISRWGNAIDTTRQSTWYISSIEKRIVLLDGVTKPILEERNEAAYIGLPKPRKSWEGKPINYDQPIVYARMGIFENILKMDYQGQPQIEVVDYGLWHEGFNATSGQNPPYIQSDVWHNGIKWRAVNDTSSEPAIGNTDWVLLTGDTALGMELVSERNFTYTYGDVNDRIIAKIYMGQMDITSQILDKDWSWTRSTDNADKDTIWNEAHKGLTNELELTQNDVQDTEGVISFTCTAYYRDGKDIIKTENKIEI